MEQITKTHTKYSQSTKSDPVFSTTPPQSSHSKSEGRDETEILCSVLKQTLMPFFIAGVGQICTGLFFERAQDWEFFLSVPETFVLLPALLGLKGNLEMTYASRFCTMSNAGKANDVDAICVIVRFNLCIIELQAIVLSLFAALISSVLSLFSCDFNFSHVSALCASGMSAAALSSLIVGFMMVSVVVLTRRYGIDPDNIAAPLTSSFSDFITLIILIGTGMFIVYLCNHKFCAISLAIILCLLICASILAYYTITEPNSCMILKSNWVAITAATIVESFSGLLLQSAISVFPGIAAFHPLITGLGGNRVSVQSSRLCTALHLSPYSLGILPNGTTVWTYLNPIRFLCLRHLDSKVALLLLITAIPYNFIFVIVVIFTSKNFDFSWIFVGAYIVVSFLQGLILFYLCQVTIYTLWRFRIDPDNSSLPVLTSIGDLLGTGFLYVVFLFLKVTSPSSIRYHHYQTMNVTGTCGIEF